MGPIEGMREELLGILRQLTKVLAQRRRLRSADIKELAKLDRSFAYLVNRTFRVLQQVWKDLVGGFLHQPRILDLIKDDRTPEVAYLHRTAIRLEEFYQGRKRIFGGFSMLRDLARALRASANTVSQPKRELQEKTIQSILGGLHAYFQPFTNDLLTLIRQEGEDLLALEGIGADDPQYVLSNILAAYVAFLTSVLRVAGQVTRTKVSRVRNNLKAAMLTGVVLLSTGGPVRISSVPVESRAQAKTELQTEGITHEQRHSHIPVVNDALYRGIRPHGYDLVSKAEAFLPQLIKGRNDPTTRSTTVREDAWRLYLGLPQQHRSFGISDWVPKGYAGTYCYRINGWFERYFNEVQPFRTAHEYLKYQAERLASGASPVELDGGETYAMGHFTLGIDTDERGTFLYYYDVWDLNVSIENNGGFFGKPFVIYDRLYFNPATFEPLDGTIIVKTRPAASLDTVGTM